MLPSGRNPRIPREAAGLVVALQAQARGDEAPLRAWFRTGFRALVCCLEAAGYGKEFAEEVASKIVDGAFENVQAGETIRNERAWMARVAANARNDLWRDRRKMRRCAPALASLPPSLSRRLALTTETRRMESAGPAPRRPSSCRSPTGRRCAAG